MKWLLVIAGLLVVVLARWASAGLMTDPGTLMNAQTGNFAGAAVVHSALLIQTGSKFLIQTGSVLLIQ